ncbi:MAG TPA: hypothetical protein VHL11_12585 [Phototrophicaceae bacterium]|nr:hypothetical protein [Phototrophicaceae bacterium]
MNAYKFRLTLICVLILTGSIFTSKSVTASSAECQVPADFPPAEFGVNWSPQLEGNLNAVALSPDGMMLAASTNTMIYLYDPQTLTELTRLEQKDKFSGGYPLAWSPDGTKLATFVSPTLGIYIWDVAQQKVSKILVLPGDAPEAISYSLAWSPDGTKIAISGIERLQTRVWDVEHEKIIYQDAVDTTVIPDSSYGTSSTIIWSSDGKYLIFPKYGSFIYILETSSWTQVGESLSTGMRNILGLAWSDKGYLAAVGDNYSILVWDTTTWKLSEMPGSDEFQQGFGVSWSPDGTLLAVGRTNVVEIIDVAQSKIVQRLPEHSAPVYDLIWLPDHQMITRSRDGWVYRWNLDTECIEAAVQIVQE